MSLFSAHRADNSYLSDPLPRPKPSERGPITKLQSKALDILQILVGNGEIPRPSLLKLRSGLLDKLETCTKAGEVTLQNKLLHILHKTITLASHPHKSHRRTASVSSTTKDDPDAFEKSLAHVIIDGVSARANQGVLQHWVDFVLMVAPSLQTRPRILHTLCDCFSLQTKSTVLQMREQLNGGATAGRGVGDAEVNMLLSGLERLVTLSGSVAANGRGDEGRIGNDGGSSILGLVSGVFISDTPDDKASDNATAWMMLMPVGRTVGGVARKCHRGFARFVVCDDTRHPGRFSRTSDDGQYPRSYSTGPGEDVQDADERDHCWLHSDVGGGHEGHYRRGDL